MEITSLIAVSDLHINSKAALRTPRFILDDGDKSTASRWQRELWDCWLDFCDQAGKLEGKKILILNGDLGELDTQRRSNQLITVNKADIVRLVMDTLEPILAVADGVIVIRGTQAHEGKSAWLEELAAHDITTAIKATQDGAASWWQWRRLIGSARIDIAHHARMGGKPWTKKNSANNLAAEVVWDYVVNMREPAPDLVIRSHNHTWADSGDNYPSRVIYTPCWTGLTEYAYRIGYENKMPDIGGLFVKCHNGFECDKVQYKPKAERIWTRL